MTIILIRDSWYANYVWIHYQPPVVFIAGGVFDGYLSERQMNLFDGCRTMYMMIWTLLSLRGCHLYTITNWENAS